MDSVDWDAVLKDTLYAVLGSPVHEASDKVYWPGRETGRGDNSRSFTYTLLGEYAGHWHDWSVGIGGLSVFKFLEFWNGWDRGQSLDYLRDRGFLSSKDDFVPSPEYRQFQHTKACVEKDDGGLCYTNGGTDSDESYEIL